MTAAKKKEPAKPDGLEVDDAKAILTVDGESHELTPEQVYALSRQFSRAVIELNAV